MSRDLGFLLLATLLSLGEGRRVFLKAGDPLELVKEIIYEANHEVDKRNMSVIAVDVGSNGYWVKNGTLRKLDTLELRGERQFFNQTDEETGSVFTYDLTVGLEELNFEGEVGFRVLWETEGTLKVSVSGEALRVQGTITSRNDGSCSATLDRAVLEELGSIEIKYEGNWLLSHILQFGIKHILPYFKDSINKELAEIVKNQVPKSDFEKLACQPFVI